MTTTSEINTEHDRSTVRARLAQGRSGYGRGGRGRIGDGFETLEGRNLLAVVSVMATDALAFENQSTGTFVFSRDGSLAAPLTLNYALSGTATAGVDYQSLSGVITIPAGLASTSLALVPIADAVAEATETVTLTLSASTGNTFDLSSATIRLRDAFYGGAVNAIVPLTETFTLHSLPGAHHTIYLDFDGGVVNDPAWLSGSTINVNPFSIEGTTAFSDNELGMIQRVWESVSEDYRPFGVDVTTELPDVEKLRKVGTNDLEWGLRVMIGDPIEYNVGATGRAMTGSFNASYDEVAWVDLSNSGFTIKNARTVAGIASHEVGHALGLEHDGGSPGGSYYEGSGTGEADWSPIMGNIFPSVLTIWSKGSYPTADNPEDDLAILTTQNGFTYRPDDHADSAANATNLSTLAVGQLRSEGVIERNTDADFFTFASTGGQTKILITPASVDPDIDLKAELFDASLTSLGVSDVSERLSASFDIALTAGTYYVKVTGAGNRTWATNGYDNYASLGAYSVDVNGVGVLGSFVPSNSTSSGTPLAGVTQFPNVTLGGLTLVGLGSGSNNDAWPIWVTGTASQDLTKYVKFTVTPPAGEQIDLSKLTVTLQDWANSTSTVAVRTSRDNFAANVDGTRALSPNAGGDYWFDLTPTSADTGPVEIRLYIWGGTTGSRELDSLKLYGRSRSTAPPPNIAPVANADSASTSGPAIAIDVLANDVDANGDVLSVQSIGTQPAHGTVVVNVDNTITYTPVAGYAGTDAFTYVATDGLLSSNVATVSLTVSTDELPPIPPGTTPQFTVNQAPRLQLGNAPLVGFAGSELDRVSVLWQTQSAGTGSQDSFTVQYRLAGTQNAWQSAGAIVATSTGVEGRIVREASITGLQWDTNYEYRVRQLRAGGLVQQWSSQFRTRLAAGDTDGFSFVAYGDSASITSNDGFRQVQARINQMNPAFAVLLGDNVYESGTHQESDARFDPLLNPEAATWMASHIDYLGLGNHDVIYSGHEGRESEENFAVPVPVAGVNAPVAPPATERVEHNFSWDYGDVHFVTFDTNAYNDPTRLSALLDYVVADLNASQARWKIVYGHHPISAAPDKVSEWDGSAGRAYYDAMVSRLQAAGVDLLMFGHSHTFSWTHPLTGRDNTGEITYMSGAYDDFTTGSGVPQLISGVGGKDLRSGSYSTEPYVAAGWTTSQAYVNGVTSTSGQLVEDGIARVDVTQDKLTISYIAADNGAVIGSFSINHSDSPPTDPPPDPTTSVTFQDGLNSYAGTLDVRLAASTPATQDGANVLLGVDGSPLEHTLVQFTSIFGTGTNQIPPGATIQSAVLKLRITDPGDAVSVHRMLSAWTESATWDSFVSGVQADGVEAASSADATFSTSATGVASIDVTAALQAWSANPTSNRGWVLLPGGTNGVDLDSSEATTTANRPSLTVTYTNTGGDPPTPHTPTAVDDSATTAEDSSVAIAVLTNDSDPDGDSLTPTVVTQPAHGAATVNGSGTVTYTPTSDYHGNDSFTYRVSDGANVSNTATVSVTITPVNDAPTAVADNATTSINTGVAIQVLTNDVDADGDSLTPSIVIGPAHGSAVVNSDGTVTYTPTAAYVGADSFTYRVFDGAAYSAAVTVNLTVNANLASLAKYDPIGSQGSANLAGTTTVAGATVGPLTRVGATYGTNTNLWPVYWYSAMSLDPAQYLTFSLTLPATQLADLGQLTVSFYEWVTGTSNVALRTSLDGFAANVGGVQVLADTGAADVLFDLTPLPAVGGTVVFRIYLYDGVDATAGWRDIRSSLSNSGKGVFLEGTTLPNNAPVAVGDAATTNEDTAVAISVLANDSDADGQSLTPSVVTAPAHGTATVNSNGTITYSPTANFFGSDSFTYRVSDGGLNSSVATVSVNVAAVNDAPVVTNDSFTTVYQTTLTRTAATGVLANDSDVEGSPLVASLMSGPSHGVLTLNADGSFQYSPATGYIGPDSFVYAASDGSLATSGTVTITVAAPPDDHGNLTNSTATPVTLSGGTSGTGSATGVFEIVGDRDVFQVTAAKGRLTVNLTGVGGLDTYLRIYDSAGTQIAFNDDAGSSLNSAVTINVNAGTYYLSAGSKNDLSTGSFSINVELKAQVTKTFQQNVNGYTSASDTFVSAYYPTTNFSTWNMNEIDYASSTMQVQSLLQFKNLFGSRTSQIPFGSELLSATLTFYVTNGGNRVLLHRMLVPWTDAVTWNSMVSGIQVNGVEAVSTADAQTPMSTPTGWQNLDVLSSLTAWAANPNSNNGWAMMPTGTDGVDYYSVNNSSYWSPKLSVDYLAPSGDLYVNTPTTAATNLTITNNQASVFGSLEFVGDRDVFQFTLTATKTVTVRLSAFGGSPLDTWLRLYDDAAVLVAEDDDSGPGTDSLLTITLSPGRYYLSAGSYLDQSIGDYWLELQT